jgi:diguanylate cyclase
MDSEIQLRRSLEIELAGASERNELSLHYQPIVDLAAGETRGVEALMRWAHPVKGMIPPSLFVPIAEDAGLIVKISEDMLRRACREAMLMPPDWSIAVNLSAVQFLKGDLAVTVAAALAESGLPPHRLEIEVTESVMISNDRKALDVLEVLKRLGVRVALDDFGTGYSSLSYLRRFAFDMLKIDRSFVQDIPYDQQSVQIVQSIASLAQTLGMSIVAEGIERHEQCPILRRVGCNYGQGYLFSKPVPFAQIRQWTGKIEESEEAAIAI